MIEDLQRELAGVPIIHHLQTMLISTGLVSMGVAVGVKFAALKTKHAVATEVSSQGTRNSLIVTLNPLYNTLMKTALFITAISLCAGVLLALRGETDE